MQISDDYNIFQNSKVIYKPKLFFSFILMICNFKSTRPPSWSKHPEGSVVQTETLFQKFKETSYVSFIVLNICFVITGHEAMLRWQVLAQSSLTVTNPLSKWLQHIYLQTQPKGKVISSKKHISIHSQNWNLYQGVAHMFILLKMKQSTFSTVSVCSVLC